MEKLSINKEQQSFKEEIDKVLDFTEKLESSRLKTQYVGLNFYNQFYPEKMREAFSQLSSFSRYFDGATEYQMEQDGIKKGTEEFYSQFEERKQKLLDEYNPKELDTLFLSLAPFEERSPDLDRAGILNYQRDLEDNNENISIHFSKNSTTEQDVGLQDSLKILCDQIIESQEFPQKITATSWLMGVSGVRERAGFELVESYPFDGDIVLNDSVWGQFIDENENIKKKELQYLFENKKPRYEKTRAELDFKDFVRKYGQAYLDTELTFIDKQEYFVKKKELEELKEKISEESKKSLDIPTSDFFKLMIDVTSNNPVWELFWQTDTGGELKRLYQGSFQENITQQDFLEQNPFFVDGMRERFDELTEEYLNQFKKAETIVIPSNPQ